MKTEQDEQNKPTEQQEGYPDINKADTKFIVIVSFICLAAILLLSILFPEDRDTSANVPSTETTAETETN